MKFTLVHSSIKIIDIATAKTSNAEKNDETCHLSSCRTYGFEANAHIPPGSSTLTN